MVQTDLQMIYMEYETVLINPDKESLRALNCDYFLTHKFKHVFWVLKRTISLRRFF